MTTLRPLFAFLLLTLGCATSNEASPLIKRAVFEMECPREKLTWQKFDAETYGVRGCGKTATYVYACRGTGMAETCNWLRNN